MRARQTAKPSRTKSAPAPAPRSRPAQSAPVSAAQFELTADQHGFLWRLLDAFAHGTEREGYLAAIETLLRRGLNTTRQLRSFAVVRRGPSDFSLAITLAPSSAVVVLADDGDSPTSVAAPVARADRSDDILDELKAIHSVLSSPQKVTVIRDDGRATEYFRETIGTKDVPRLPAN